MASAGKSATRVAVLASGQGGTFQALVEAGRRGEMPAEVVLLIVSRRDVLAAELADRLGIERVVLDERLVGSAADFFADVFPGELHSSRRRADARRGHHSEVGPLIGHGSVTR